MGSMITLGIGEMEVDWGKNWYFNDYSKLFLPTDQKDIPYYYADNIVENKLGYSRRLSSVKERLELLGYSKHNLKTLYQDILDNYPDYYPPIPLTFENIIDIFSSINIKDYKNSFEEGDYSLGEYTLEHILNNKLFEPLRQHLSDDLIYDQSHFFENLDIKFLLRLLMENPKNLDLDLEWRTADIIEGGYVDDVYVGLDDRDKFLIVTEGTSDTFIIKKAIELLRPDILDFFTFIDMEDNYPFTGTGNLFRFCQGLSSIKIQNKVLVIFDNDLEGVSNFDKVQKLKLPPNMGVMKLPDCKYFDDFLTVDVSGESKQNINGRAVAIECFLDFTLTKKTTHRVRWTNYIKDYSNYQGSLEDKESYIKPFKNLRGKRGYDFSKLEILIEAIYQNCIQLV